MIYIYYVYQLIKAVNNPLLRGMLALALLTAAFPLEFFAQARGYGMSLAFLMAAVYHAWRYAQETSIRQQLLLWFWMTLAVAANLSLINTFLIFIGLVVLCMIVYARARSLGQFLSLAFGISTFAMAVVVAYELKERRLLYTGKPDGFMNVTVSSLLRYQMDSGAYWLTLAVTIIGLAACLYLGYAFFRKMRLSEISLGETVAGVLLLNALASISLNLLFGMNFPENRVGLYFIPLFLLTLAFAIDHLAAPRPAFRWVGVVFLFFPTHLIKHLTIGTTLLWGQWHVSEGLYLKAKREMEKEGRVLTVNGYYLNELGWAVYNFQHGVPMQPQHRDTVLSQVSDLVIARPRDFEIGSLGFDTIYRDEPNNVYLLRNPNRLSFGQPVTLSNMPRHFSGNNESYEFLNMDADTSLLGKFGMIQFVADLQCDNGLIHGQLVVALEDSTGELLSYDAIPLHWLRPEWNGDRLTLHRLIRFPTQAKNFKFYLWNVGRHTLRIDVQELRLSPIS